MDEETIQIEVHHEGAWRNAFELHVFEPDRGVQSRSRGAYRHEYVMENIDSLGTRDERTVAEAHPLLLDSRRAERWPAFLLDIMPAGAARRWWKRRLTAGENGELSEAQLDFRLLRECTIAPIGHLRVARASDDAIEPVGFPKSAVVERATDFLEYAADQGAAIGGATGAGGDAPKVLLAEGTDGDIYPDAALSDETTVACWFVKWPRGQDRDDDRIVLRTEHLYAETLAQLGFPTCPGELRTSTADKPSLWLPRFDRVVAAGTVKRRAVESFYSLAGITQPGQVVHHQQFLSAMAEALQSREQAGRIPDLVLEYVRRELLDLILGNSDNHGRNRALFRGDTLSFTPIYDLAPMVLDPAGVTRSSKWGAHEVGGRIDWGGVKVDLEQWVDRDELDAALAAFAEQVRPLPDLLHEAGLHDRVMNHHRIYLRNLDQKLEEWGLR